MRCQARALIHSCAILAGHGGCCALPLQVMVVAVLDNYNRKQRTVAVNQVSPELAVNVSTARLCMSGSTLVGLTRSG